MLVLLVAWMAAVVAAVGIPLSIIQMVPIPNGSAVSFVNTSALIAMGFVNASALVSTETFDEERASAFFVEHFPGTELLSMYRGCVRSAMRSGLFRIAAVSKMGGFYMDAAAG